MALPLVVAFLAVLLGTLLALGPREGAAIVRPIRLVALVAALAVIGTHLMPEALHELGALALLGFAGGAGLPWLTEQIGARVSRRHAGAAEDGARVGLEIAYGGLLVHRFGDGLSMGASSRAVHGAAGQAAVVFAIALHIVPVTTVMLLAVQALRGPRAALLRGALLAVSTMAGVLVAGAALGARPGDEELSPWISALVAGLLLHVVAHDVPRPHAHGNGNGNPGVSGGKNR